MTIETRQTRQTDRQQENAIVLRITGAAAGPGVRVCRTRHLLQCAAPGGDGNHHGVRGEEHVAGRAEGTLQGRLHARSSPSLSSGESQWEWEWGWGKTIGDSLIDSLCCLADYVANLGPPVREPISSVKVIEYLYGHYVTGQPQRDDEIARNFTNSNTQIPNGNGR